MIKGNCAHTWFPGMGKSSILLGCYRLPLVSNFGDGDCGAGEIDTRARAKFRGDATRRERRFSALPSRRVASKFRARACVYFARPTIAIAKIRDYSQSRAVTVPILINREDVIR